MDVQRQKNIAYEYLCHLEEAKMFVRHTYACTLQRIFLLFFKQIFYSLNNLIRWIEACIQESLPEVTEMEEILRNGVFLAKLAHFMSSETVPLRRIYDSDMSRYEVSILRALICLFRIKMKTYEIIFSQGDCILNTQTTLIYF